MRADAQGKLINQMEKYQTIQIGANIIDQYSSDNYPTPIELNSQIFYGIKNLPYFNSSRSGNSASAGSNHAAAPANVGDDDESVSSPIPTGPIFTLGLFFPSGIPI